MNGLLARVVVEIDGRIDGLNAAYKAGVAASNSFVQKLSDDFAIANADIAAKVKAGLLSPATAKEQGAAAGRAYRQALDAEIARVSATHGPFTVDEQRARSAQLITLRQKLAAIPTEATAAESALSRLAAGTGLSGRLGGLTAALEAPALAAGVLAAGLAGVAAQGIAAAEANERAFTRVATQLDQPRAALQELRDDLRDASSEYGVAQAEVLKLADGIAQGGAGGAEGVREMTRATLELAAATGGDAGGLAGGLDFILDAFGILPERAEEAAAALFSIGRGKVPLQDVLETLSKTSAAAQQNKISFETMAGATATLLDLGRTGKQASTELNQLAGAGAEGRRRLAELAAQSPITADAVGKLRQAAADNVPAVQQFTTTIGNLFESMAATGPAERLLGLLREITHELQSGQVGAGARLGDRLASYEGARNVVAQNRAMGGVFGAIATFDTRNAVEYEAGRVVGEVRTLAQVDGGLAALDAARLDRARRAVAEYKALVRDGSDAYAHAVDAQLKLDAEVQRRAAAGGPAALGAGRAPVKPVATAAEQAAARKAADAAAAKQAAARASFTRATAGLTPGGADDFQAQLKALVDAAREAHLKGGEIARLTADFRKAAAAKVADELRTQIVQGTLTQVDDALLLLQRFDEQVAQSAATGTNTAAVQAAQAARRAQLADEVEIVRQREDLAKRLQAMDAADAGGFAQPVVQMRELLALLDTAQAEVDATKDGTRAHAAALERVRDLQAQIAKLQGKQTTQAQQLESQTGKLAGHLKGVANVAAGLVTAFGGANGELARMLTGVAGVAGGVEDLFAAAGKAGGFGALFSSGAGLAAAAGPLGAIVAGLGAASALFGGGETALERQRRQVQEDNTKALRELATKLGALDTVGTGRADETAALVVQRTFGRLKPGTFGGGALELLRQLEAAGLSLADFQAVAKARGITIGDPAKGEVSRDQLEALLTALGSAGAQFADAQERLDVLGAGALERLTATLAALGAVADTTTQKTGSVAKAILAQFDLSSDVGRQAALAYARARYQAGEITGDIARQIISLLEGASQEAERIAGAAGTADTSRSAQEAASAAAQLTEATGLSLVDYARSHLGVARQGVDYLAAIAAALRASTPAGPIAPPDLSRVPGLGYGGSPAAAPAAAPVYHVTVNLGGVTVRDAAAAEDVGRGIGLGILDTLGALDGVDRGLAERALHHARAAGATPTLRPAAGYTAGYVGGGVA